MIWSLTWTCRVPGTSGQKVDRLFFSPQNKNTHLNQAIHEEQEAILELRVQLRLLQSHKLQQDSHVVPPAAEPPAGQPSPEERSKGDESTKRSAPGDPAGSTSTATSTAAPANEKPGKDTLKPSPSKTYTAGPNQAV